ncbi:MAG: DUF1295 domain-containing protein [Clostridia bacterium]|nr:DUF1295 domain-containing protein [Clostridia bacterium]MBQ3100106.1 DUF1295 domain-containing protein [Clostridia bacterium]
MKNKTIEKNQKSDMIYLSRAKSFIFIAAVYIMAFGVGFLSYQVLPFSPWLNLLLADVFATIYVFLFSLAAGNASVYDPYWSVQPIAILSAFAVSVKTFSAASVLVLIAVLIWGFRLTANWAYTFHGIEHQDWRYTMLREKTGKFYPIINFVGIHMVPTLIVYAATLPAVLLINLPGEANLWTVVGFAISLIAVAVQTVSDIEMHKYRKTRATVFIREGLWKHSRHPNYLGEILMWWGVAVMAMSVFGFEWFLPLGALLNTVLFFAVSIPMADKRQSLKEGFAEYKSETHMLLPIPRFKK